MKKMGLTLMMLATALLLASGIAYAKSFVGTNKDDTIKGTSQNDTISGGGKNDTINGKGGKDRVYGDSGADTVSGGAGNDDVFGGKGADTLNGNGGDDYINAADNRGGDVIDCGTGIDSLVYDAVDFENPDLRDVGTAGLPVQDADTFTNCEDNTTAVLINPDTGTDAEDIDIQSMSLPEVEEAIEDGTLIEVK